MNKVKKCLVSILSVVLLIVSLAGCSSKSPSDLIVGQWEIPKEIENIGSITKEFQLNQFRCCSYILYFFWNFPLANN